MAVPVGQFAFNAGEVRPALFGHADLTKLHSAAATMRNIWAYYSGGAFSRGGTAFIDYSKQTGRSLPPRCINFQFSIQQGRILEFGNFYMRVIIDGAFVTDSSLPISAATNSNPLTITVPATGGQSASPINGGVFSSYNGGDTITLAGGDFSVPAQLTVTATELLGITPSLGTGAGYAPTNTVTLAGGTPATKAILTISTTRVNAAAPVALGTGGTPGNATVTGSTGTGTKFQAIVLIGAGGAIANVLSISVAGAYSVNPSNVAAEPVTGGGLSGATLSLSMGPNAVAITNAGAYTANPAGGLFTQFSTSGSGTGAEFSNALMGVQAAAITTPGSYTTDPTNPVAQASSSGSGLGVTFTMAFTTQPAFVAGDWLFLQGVGGMTELNGRTAVITAALGAGRFSLQDVFGNPINSTAFGLYTSGGTASRIYTTVSPYAEADLKWLKFAQSADVMSFTCVNQDTGAEYPPYDLKRLSDSNWQFDEVTMAETIAAPNNCAVAGTFNWSLFEATQPSSSTTPSVASYQYCVTAVNPIDGTESVASPIGQLLDAVNIQVTAGTINVYWNPVPPAGLVVPSQYNIYKATPTSQAAFGGAPAPPVGAIFGFVGTGFGNSFADNNIIPDFSQTPPKHQNPFARGQIVGVNVRATGANYTFAGVLITTSTGSGASIVPIISGGAVVGYLMQDNGQNYLATDTLTVVGDGGGATATIQFGAFSGTYPGTVTYFQARRGYANTTNNPDTYFWSQPGSFTNFDTRIPTIDSDAITGSPWGQQVDGIQWFVVMPGGTIALTGLGAWFVGGQGSSSFNPQPITPQGQQALPETFNGASPTIPPVRIDYDIVFANPFGRFLDIQVQYFTNIITGVDICLTSDHLFLGHMPLEVAWCPEPYKLFWSVRDDGVLLSMTYYKQQEVLGWARHDTQGSFVSIASITEIPVTALYMATERIDPANGNFYAIERMDNRVWTGGVESTWCVDCALANVQPEPGADLTVNSPGGLGAIQSVVNQVGGQGYSAATFAYIVDANGQGPGAGAVLTLDIIGGVINNTIVTAGGTNYTSPQIVYSDPSAQGSGAAGTAVLNNQAMFTADSPVFAAGDVGQVIRAGGGIATITAFTSSTIVTGNLTQPIATGLNAAGAFFSEGDWTMTAPTNIVGGLFHLIGQTVTGLMDGNPIPPTVVNPNGQAILPAPATAITVGLSFLPQLQGVYLEAGNPTIQGQRKKIGAATARVENSRGIQIGSNQVDGSTLNPIQIGPQWFNMADAPDQGFPAYENGVMPLWTGDVRIAVGNDLGKPGQVAIQQPNPLPLNVTAIITESLEGDTPSQQAPKKQQQGAQGGRGG